MDAQPKAPLAIVGVPRHRRGGGIPQAGRFPHRFVLSRSTSCESLSHGYAVPAPFGKGAFFAPGIVTAVQDWASTISSRYHPICKQSACRPLAPSVTCGDSSLPEGAVGCCVSTLDLWELEVPTVNPSGKNQRFLPAPFRKGACAVPPLSMRTMAFYDSLLPLQCPVSAARRPFGAKRSLLQIYATGSFFTKW